MTGDRRAPRRAWQRAAASTSGEVLSRQYSILHAVCGAAVHRRVSPGRVLQTVSDATNVDGSWWVRSLRSRPRFATMAPRGGVMPMPDKGEIMPAGLIRVARA